MSEASHAEKINAVISNEIKKNNVEMFKIP